VILRHKYLVRQEFGVLPAVKQTKYVAGPGRARYAVTNQKCHVCMVAEDYAVLLEQHALKVKVHMNLLPGGVDFYLETFLRQHAVMTPLRFPVLISVVN
jgi:hypothetical protein